MENIIYSSLPIVEDTSALEQWIETKYGDKIEPLSLTAHIDLATKRYTTDSRSSYPTLEYLIHTKKLKVVKAYKECIFVSKSKKISIDKVIKYFAIRGFNINAVALNSVMRQLLNNKMYSGFRDEVNNYFIEAFIRNNGYAFVATSLCEASKYWQKNL